MKTIGIVGSRRRDSKEDYELCLEALDEIYEEGDRLVSGGCHKGGDRFAEIIAKSMGLTITIHYAAWNKHGKAAGFVRNTYIAQDADVLIALVARDRTGGTEDTIKKALKLGKEVILVWPRWKPTGKTGRVRDMNQKNSRKTELHCAYEWTCDECGRNNFASAITVEMTPEDIAAMIEEHGGDEGDWQTGHWMTHPEEVTCQHCGATFETEDWEEPEKP